MSNASNWLEEAVLNHFFRNSTVSSPAQVFLALYKTNPTDFDNGIEISGGGYVRQQITFSAPAQIAGVGTISNNNTLVFPEATADWTGANESVGYWGVRTALSGGSLLAYGEFLDVGKLNDGKYAVTQNDQFNVGAGRVTIQFNQKASNWLQNAVLNHFFRSTPVISPSQIFLALYKSDPTGADVGVEITYTSYARQLVTFDVPTQISGNAVVKNSAAINYPIPDTDIGSVPFFGLRDASASGNLLAYAAWDIAKNISAGMQFSVNAGNIEVSMA